MSSPRNSITLTWVSPSVRICVEALSPVGALSAAAAGWDPRGLGCGLLAAALAAAAPRLSDARPFCALGLAFGWALAGRAFRTGCAHTASALITTAAPTAHATSNESIARRVAAPAGGICQNPHK